METTLDFVNGNTRRCLFSMALPLIAAMFQIIMVNLHEQSDCRHGNESADQKHVTVILMEQVECLAERRPHYHRTGREHDATRRGELGE